MKRRFSRKYKRKKLVDKAPLKANRHRLSRTKLRSNQKSRVKSVENENRESVIFIRRLKYPYNVKNRQAWSSRRHYDEYEDLYYDYDDYMEPIEFQTSDYYWDVYDDERRFARRQYLPLERTYRYGGGGYPYQKSSDSLLPILALLGILGILFNLVLGKIYTNI